MTKPYTKHTVFFKLLVAGILHTLIHILLERWHSYAVSDVTLSLSAHLVDIGLIVWDATYFFIIYALLFVSLRHFGRSASLGAILLVVALSLFNHLGNWAAFLLTENVTASADVTLSFINAISAVAIEMIQYLFVLGLALWLLSPRRTPPVSDEILCLATCGILLAINLISRMIGDIEYGLPDSQAEAWGMVAYYLFDILLYGGLGYLDMTHTMKKEKTHIEKAL